MTVNEIIVKLESSSWNIGIAYLSANQIIKQTGLLGKNIHWLKHSYKDRFFADPFFLSVDDHYLEIMVEEYLFTTESGRLVILKIDRNTFTLVDRHDLLDTDNHLSYPIDFYYNGNHYLYPENGENKHLPLYRFGNNKLIFVRDLISTEQLNTISEENWLADATMLYHNKKYYIFATLSISNDQLSIFQSDSPIDEFKHISEIKLNNDSENSRPAGNFFNIDDKLFRPVQNCSKTYGGSLIIREVIALSESELMERTVTEIHPISYRYNRGIHTINFKDGLCVVDGRGYRFSFARILLPLLYGIRNLGLKLKKWGVLVFIKNH